MSPPDPSNAFQKAHAQLLLSSFHQLTGNELVPPGPDAAKRLFEAPFFVASHSPDADPILTYGNLTALDLFEMTWDEFTSTPSRFTAEAPLREERARLLERVTKHGYIDDYSGIRISRSGKRFQIRQATVWNLVAPNGRVMGQAATFNTWNQVASARS
ncbi:MEKHLA domain-containing protein [Haloferula sp.]|uniref:MEKHLA domain-containing protein n=1 Tax=Haloferula sp. TaxID=2497595 RepID=UPI003C7908B1